MTRAWRNASLVLGAATLAAGLPIWFVPYSGLNLLDRGSLGRWVVAGVLSGALAGGLLPGFLRPVAGVSLGFVTAVVLRIMVEMAVDPSRHALWRFEVLSAAMVAAPAGLIGVTLIRLAGRRGG